jgi:GT2 family glycosyltransferase
MKAKLTRQPLRRHRSSRPRVSIVIPVFNQAALTAQCLRNLPERHECETIVVDDASTDHTAQILEEFNGLVKCVRHRVNHGFSVSCNQGAAAGAARDYLVFLNNDTVPQPGWLEALVQYADAHPAAAVVGSKLLYLNNTIQHAGVVICQDRYPRHIYTGFPAGHLAVSRSRRFQIVTAACMLIRRRIFERAGGFDTAFRNGFEDVDLCLRLGQQGMEIHYCAESVVHHLESVSSGRFRHDRANVDLYRKRWMDRVHPDDLQYYLEDGLLRISYEGRYPVCMSISPLLASLEAVERSHELDRLLREKNHQLADLERENARFRLELGLRAEDSPELRYLQLRERIRKIVRKTVPAGAAVLVITKGDGTLLDMPGRQGWHFPQTDQGIYAGHHPANSTEAIAHLESLRAKGAQYLLIPATSLWWLEHYQEFTQHLKARYRQVEGLGKVCKIFKLEIQTDCDV